MPQNRRSGSPVSRDSSLAPQLRSDYSETVRGGRNSDERGSRVCLRCGTTTRANLADCPNCEAPMRFMPGEAVRTPLIERFGELLASPVWLWRLYTLLTVVVVVGNVVGLAHSLDRSPGNPFSLLVGGVAMPIVAYMVPEARGFIRRRGWILVLLPLYGFVTLGIVQWQANFLVGTYLVYLLTLFLVQDRVLRNCL